MLLVILVTKIDCKILIVVIILAGYPSDRSRDHDKWEIHRQIHRRVSYSKFYNDLLEKMGFARFPDDSRVPQTQLFTVFAFPNELTYPQIRMHKEMFNLEVFNKINPNEITTSLNEIVPAELMDDSLDGNFTGKWIYFSMGSMCSIDVQLMKRLVGILSKSNHKFIVSKGHAHTEYELARNMWGDRFLPQNQILPQVDLVLMHGGNNTLTDTFSIGKPSMHGLLVVAVHNPNQ